MVSNTAMVFLHYTIRSIWGQLGFPNRLFGLVMSLVSAWMLIFTARIWVRLRSRMARREEENVTSSRRSLTDLEDRLKNVRQFIGAAFYLFWLLFFIQFPHDMLRTESGRLSLGMAMLGTLSTDFAFGAYIVLVLLVSCPGDFVRADATSGIGIGPAKGLG
jgi:hypothetical protein